MMTASAFPVGILPTACFWNVATALAPTSSGQVFVVYLDKRKIIVHDFISVLVTSVIVHGSCPI